MDGFAFDCGELLAAARRLDEAASAPWTPPGWCARGSAVASALDRLGSAWAAGHGVLVGDAAAARDGLLRVLASSEAVDRASRDRLHALAGALA